MVLPLVFCIQVEKFVVITHASRTPTVGDWHSSSQTHTHTHTHTSAAHSDKADISYHSRSHARDGLTAAKLLPIITRRLKYD
jgi:hypothetical protein